MEVVRAVRSAGTGADIGMADTLTIFMDAFFHRPLEVQSILNRDRNLVCCMTKEFLFLTCIGHLLQTSNTKNNKLCSCGC